jgi:uncharacterized protein (TIGR02271 family)
MDNPTTQNALVAIFPDRLSADNAVQQLIGSGFKSNQVEVNSTADLERQAASGNAGLSGTHHDASGGGIAGFFHRLFSSETGEDDASYYRRAARRGNAAVIVHSDDESLDRAADILNRSGAVEVDEQEGTMRTSGASDTTRSTTGAKSGMKEDKSSIPQDKSSIPVVKEDLQVGKRAVQRGAVRVYSRIMQQPVEEKISLREERVKVDRRPANRPATEADLRAADRDAIEMTETVEEPVVSKRARVVEEVVIGKEVNERTETVRDNVMRSEVHVEDSRGERGTGSTDYDTDFRRDFQSRYGSDNSLRYDDYAPAYRYGYQMANDPRYRGRSFDEIGEDLRTDYMRRNPNSTWERMKDSVRYGWDKVTGKR